MLKLAYQWRIADPIKFIENAKTVISSPTDSDHKIDVNSLEAIENSVVDKMIMDVIREYTPNKSVGYDELSIEKDLYGLCTSRFQDRGVEFASMSVNVTFSKQIEEAQTLALERELLPKISNNPHGAYVKFIEGLVDRLAPEWMIPYIVNNLHYFLTFKEKFYD